MTLLSNRRGFTLTEAMLVVAIIGVLATMGPRLLVQANRFFIMNRARGEIQREARATMYVIARELHQAQYTTIVIDRATSQPHCSRITFYKVQGSSLQFYQNNKQLIQKVGNQKTILSKNLRYLAFTFPRSDDMTIISVSLTLEEPIYEARTTALHMASERVRVMD